MSRLKERGHVLLQLALAGFPRVELSRSARLSRSVLPCIIAGLLGCGDPSGPNPGSAVASVSITPASDTLILPQNTQLTAVVLNSSGAPLSGHAITWASSDPSVATVSATGFVMSLKLGVVTVTATAGGKTGSAVLAVAPLITVTPRRPSMFAGDTVQLTAQATDANGVPLDAGPLTWTSESAAVATVSSSGVAQGTGPGLVSIAAHAGAGVGTVVVAVLDPAPRANRELAFLTRGTDDRSEVHTVQPNGTTEKLVSIAGEYAAQFAWSADGNRLAVTYVQHNGSGISGLYVSNADGSSPVRLFEAVYAPRWSPDGSRIAFSRCVSSIDECDIYTVRSTSGEIQTLTTELGSEQSPQWSPDGRRIAYVRVMPTGATLWVMDDDGTHKTELHLPVDAFNPRWSPDGKTIAVDNGTGVWLVNADGSDPRPLTGNCSMTGVCDGSVQYTAPDWSFDAQKIAYQSSGLTVVVSTRAGDVFAEGGNALFGAPVPQWSPDGTMISYIGTDPTPPSWPGVAVMAGDATGSQFITGAQNAIPTIQTQEPGGGRRWRP